MVCRYQLMKYKPWLVYLDTTGKHSRRIFILSSLNREIERRINYLWNKDLTVSYYETNYYGRTKNSQLKYSGHRI